MRGGAFILFVKKIVTDLPMNIIWGRIVYINWGHWEEIYMPKLARQQDDQYRINYYTASQSNVKVVRSIPVRKSANTRKIERNNFIHKIVSIAIISVIGLTVLPVGFNKVTKMLLNPSPYKQVKADYHKLLFPTSDYLSNDWFMGELSLRGPELKKPQMTSLVENMELVGLRDQLSNLASMYPSIHPSVYVWDYETGNYVDINANEIFPTASIIKLPVLVQLFRSIEKSQLSLYDEMPLTEYYRSEGSGSLQFKAANSIYTIDTLARMMITESDNSATNMLMSRLGSMTDINTGIREWGLKHTYVRTWLPDLGGTNHSTTRDMATILYNIDNPNFLSVSSREKIFDYMGHVHNNRLIAAGLPAGAVFLHKTGDIGKMLGDAGIVYAPNGKKYIVVIFANRPHNSPLGKEFIVKASQTIYNYMVM